MLIIVSRVQRVQVVAEGRQGLGATTGSTAIKPNTFPKITDSRPLSLQQVSTVRAESHQEKSVAFLWLFAETHFNLHSARRARAASRLEPELLSQPSTIRVCVCRKTRFVSTMASLADDLAELDLDLQEPATPPSLLRDSLDNTIRSLAVRDDGTGAEDARLSR